LQKRTRNRFDALSDDEEEHAEGRPPSRFRSDFEVLERLGKGGFGQVCININ